MRSIVSMLSGGSRVPHVGTMENAGLAWQAKGPLGLGGSFNALSLQAIKRSLGLSYLSLSTIASLSTAVLVSDGSRAQGVGLDMMGG